MIIFRLNKSVGFNLTAKDKEAIQLKAEELGISVSAMVRGIVLEKYRYLTIGYMKPGYHDIDIKGLKPPKIIMSITKEHISMRECVNELKEVFAKGLDVLGKIDDAELGLKTEKELKELLDRPLGKTIKVE